MKDNYQPANAIEFGSVEKTVLGAKPRTNEIESLMGSGYSTPLPDDIDESDD
ncbi:MAG TPA: hypothetical protein VFQ43_04980 [Nitrososphaera sp.]|nr:hypothetical protein [Nitrososphaera sp.]